MKRLAVLAAAVSVVVSLVPAQSTATATGVVAQQVGAEAGTGIAPAAGAPTVATADEIASVPTATPPAGETSVALDVSFGIRPVPPSRLTLPRGETLRVTAPAASGADYIWTKNGEPIAGATTNVLVLDHVTSADAGAYVCFYSRFGTVPRASQVLLLGIGGTGRLTNLTFRGILRPGAGETFTAGFVIEAGSGMKKMLVRAIGPSLTHFGVEHALRRPVLRIFDHENRPYSRPFFYPAVSDGLTHAGDLAASQALAGAFPVPEDGGDAIALMAFPTGAYTAQVSSDDGSGGDVLLEVYEVP